MSKFITAKLIAALNLLKDKSLNNPYIFNNIRNLIAGNQNNTKLFVKNYLDNYKCKSVIDICSGTGDFASIINKNINYLGMDMNKNFINYSKKMHKTNRNKVFKKANVLNKSYFANKEFDATLLISTMHHFSDEELNTLLPIVNKITKKIVVIADIIPNPPNLIQKIFVKLDQGKHIRSEKDKIRILKKYFKIIEAKRISSRFAMQYGIICEV